MKKILVALLIALGTQSALATTPQSGDVICATPGTNPYDPMKIYTAVGGPYPTGTVIVSGNCSWQKGAGCGKIKINNQGKNRNAFWYTYNCLNVPLDDYVFGLLLIPIAFFGYRFLKRHALMPL